ncbi:hypothetical protein COOONC_20646 [Cooperia oncophora]
MRGEAALVVLEALSDSVERLIQPEIISASCCLASSHSPIVPAHYMRLVKSQPTGFHQVLSVLEQFIGAKDPFQLQFSSLIEPSFRLLQRLVSIDCVYSQAVLRFVRSINLIQQLGCIAIFVNHIITGKLHSNVNAADGPALLSVTRMVSGSILHLAALEVSSLLKSGHFNIPHEMYSTLLETSDAVVNSDESSEGVDNLLFSLLRHGHIELTEEIEYPRLVHFNAHKLQALFDTCKTTTVFNIAQYDIEYLHELLTREIVSTQAEDTTAVTREMEAVLTYGTDVNEYNYYHERPQEQLVLRFVLLCLKRYGIVRYPPVPCPFLNSVKSQLEMLTDAAFLLVEYVSGCGAEEQVAVCTTLLRLCRSICSLSKQEYTEVFRNLVPE